MTKYRIKIRNGRVYLEENNDSVYINSDPPDAGPYASGYYCIGSPTDVEATCHDPSCFYHSGGSIYTWCNTINGPYDTLEECEASCSGIEPVFSGSPLPPSGFRLSGFSSFSLNRAADPVCAGTNLPQQLRITFSWNINDQVNDPVHWYAIRRVPAVFIGVDDTPDGYPSGMDGQYGLAVSGVVSGALDYVTNFEPYKVDTLTGPGDSVVAVTNYDTSDSFYQYGFDNYGNTPRYTNGLGITSITFSSGESPKITFRDNTEKSRFRNLGGVSGPPMRLVGATGSMGDYSFAWNGSSGEWDLSTSNITSETATSITYSAMDSGALSDLLSDLEQRGTNNQWLYIQLTTDDLFTGLYFNEKCVFPTDIESPVILRREDLTEDGGKYRIAVSDYTCGVYGFQIIAVNPSGQSTPEYTGIAQMTQETYSWTIKEDTDARIFDSGGTDFGIQYGGSNGYDGFFVVPSGSVSFMLYASGFLYDDGGSLITTATSTNSGGTGGVLNMSRPAQGWYFAVAEEQWRVTGPSGEFLPTITSIRCGDNYGYVIN